MKRLVRGWFWLLSGWMIAGFASAEAVVVGGEGHDCRDDPACFNRIHPAIPMAARADPGQTILLHTRNSKDVDLDPTAPSDPRSADPQFGAVHPLTGPVHINGAKHGDVLAVTLLDIEPGAFGTTLITPDGLVSDEIPGPLEVHWRLNRQFAVSGLTVPRDEANVVAHQFHAGVGQSKRCGGLAQASGTGDKYRFLSGSSHSRSLQSPGPASYCVMVLLLCGKLLRDPGSAPGAQFVQGHGVQNV